MSGNVLVTRRIAEAGLDRLRSTCATVDVGPEDRSMARSELLDAVRGRDGLLCLLSDRIDDEVLGAAGEGLRVVADYAVGYDNIDVQAATRRGVLVTHTPDVLTETTADLAWSLIMSAARRIVEGDRHFRTGKWRGWGPMQFLGHDVHGATLGIVGAGRIGTAVAKRSTGFGMKLLYAGRRNHEDLDRMGGRRVELDTLLAEGDFVSLHVPGTEDNRHLISRRELGLMKPTSYLINTARGSVVDETALVEVLKEKRIAGAGLDVYENEPEPVPGLIELDNVVCIPHLGSATQATREKMAIMAADSILAVLRGERPPNVVREQA